MQNVPIIIIILFSVLSITSCDEDNGPQLDVDAPEIDILAPADGDTFDAGELIQITIDIQENVELHEYSVSLVNQQSNTITVVDFGHQHEKNIVVDKQFQLPPSTNRTYEIRVEASDHESNINTSSIKIHVN